uniref:Uncharacterized protein n=1 Tax=Anguilla anguilla TaxID=7936 RepID=A0A0E9P9D9_ANGAN
MYFCRNTVFVGMRAEGSRTLGFMSKAFSMCTESYGCLRRRSNACPTASTLLET